MDIERETVVEAGVSVAAVFAFIAAVVAVGLTYRTNGDITGTGGLAILGAMGFFIALMTAVGYWFATRG